MFDCGDPGCSDPVCEVWRLGVEVRDLRSRLSLFRDSRMLARELGITYGAAYQRVTAGTLRRAPAPRILEGLG